MKKTNDKLIEDVLSLTKRPQLKKPSRTEPTLKISEFSLVKSITGRRGDVQIKDLTKALSKRGEHADVGKKVLKADRKAKTLHKPLDKPKAERIRRSVAYDKVKKHLERWDPVVSSHRTSGYLKFPLPDTTFEAKTFAGYRLKSALQKELEELDPPKVEVYNVEESSKFPLTMKEMMEKRGEMAKLRALQSYREAKARLQGRIKSKKFHKIQRREKIKQQQKEFEELQKTDPEAALKKLEELERVRAEERASLRHRSTGKWAKNKQVQAKYDKESRQVLAQQLTISRELTQKVTVEDSESEEEVQKAVAPNNNEGNPWTNLKVEKEVEDFLSGYRKYWEDNTSKNEFSKNDDGKTDEKLTNGRSSLVENEKQEITQTLESVSHNSPIENSSMKVLKRRKANKRRHVDNSQDKRLKNKEIARGAPQDHTEKSTANENKVLKRKKTQQNMQNKKSKVMVGTTEWEIEAQSSSDEQTNSDIDDIFKKAQNKVHKSKKLLKKDLNEPARLKQSNSKTKNKHKDNLSALSIPTNPKRPVIDEQLLESTSDAQPSHSASLNALKAILATNTDQKNEKTTNIDPNNIIKTKTVNLDTEIPDLLTLDDNEENADQRGTISEAFEDDDIVAEFRKDKRAEIDADKPQDVNLHLPGWGSWGGTGIKPSKRKSKRFIVKFPKKFKRRDDNKGDLVVNEKANEKAKPHLVSEVPFPFTKVKDFEATIRAPISNTFVPETAYRKMIKPAVVTKMGTVIEPMNEELLLKKKQKNKIKRIV